MTTKYLKHFILADWNTHLYTHYLSHQPTAERHDWNLLRILQASQAIHHNATQIIVIWGVSVAPSKLYKIT